MSRSAAFGYRNKNSRGGLCSVDFLKYVVFIFNFLYLVSGFAVLGVGIWTLKSHEDYTALLTTETFVSSAALMIVAGVIVLFSSLVGCFSIGKEDRCFLLIYIFALLLVFLLEAIGGIMAYVYEEQLMVDLSNTLTDTFNSQYGQDEYISQAIDKIQIEHRCCGATKFSEWQSSTWKITNQSLNNTVPESCCKNPSTLCAIRDSPSNIWYSGCIYSLEEILGEHLLLLGAVGCGISILQIIGLVLSCCFYGALKDANDY